MRWLISIVAIFGLIQTSAFGTEENGRPRLTRNGHLGFEYHQFLLLKASEKLIALHVLPDPRYGWDGIVYTWFLLTEGTDLFFRPSPEGADRKMNPNVLSGTGKTADASGSGTMTDISIGDLRIEWSKGNLSFGWLNLEHLPKDIKFYPVQFKTLQDAHGKLFEDRWLSVNDPENEKPYAIVIDSHEDAVTALRKMVSETNQVPATQPEGRNSDRLMVDARVIRSNDSDALDRGRGATPSAPSQLTISLGSTPDSHASNNLDFSHTFSEWVVAYGKEEEVQGKIVVASTWDSKLQFYQTEVPVTLGGVYYDCLVFPREQKKLPAFVLPSTITLESLRIAGEDREIAAAPGPYVDVAHAGRVQFYMTFPSQYTPTKCLLFLSEAQFETLTGLESPVVKTAQP